MKRFLLICAAVFPCLAAEDAASIVRRSLERDDRNWDRARDYTFEQRSIQRQVDGKGKVTKTESQMHDVVILYGRPFTRLVEKNGKPLSAKERAKEEEGFNKEIEKRRRETAEENSRERRNYESRRARNRQFLREIPDAFNFTLEGEELLAGHPVYRLRAEPKPGYQPRDSRAKFLPKLTGRLWIDKTELQWVKAEATTTDSISIGLFLARIGPGAVLTFEQKRVNGELWLPWHAFMRIDARLALLKKLRGDMEIEFMNYRKFQTDSKITIAEPSVGEKREAR